MPPSIHGLLSGIRWAHLLLLALLPAWWHFSRPLSHAPTLAIWLLFGAIWLMAWERCAGHRKDWHPGRRHLKHDGSILPLVLVTDVLVSALIAVTVARLSHGDSPMPVPLQVATGVLVAEFGSYWMHRASHRGGWLWRVHVLHHRPERVNAANALTAHPLNAAWDKLARTLPLCLLGFHADAIILIALFALTQSLAVHANVAGSLGWLDYLIGNPGLHRLHHSTQPGQAGNYGTAIPLWDQVFGTFIAPGSPERAGLFDPARYPEEGQTLALLRYPFSCPDRCIDTTGARRLRRCCWRTREPA